MKNKISDLRNHMFAALERLGNEELSEEELKQEIARSQAISEIGKVIVDSAKTEVLAAKLTGHFREGSNFLDDDDSKKIERPKAQYSNTSPMGIANNNNSEGNE